MLAISVDPALANVLALGVVVLEEIAQPERPSPGAEAHLAAVVDDIRRRCTTPDSREAFQAPSRRLYRAFGIDPTKHRPSSEQLMRRLTKGDAFPRVNPLVDAVNLCQLAFGLPYGLYDLDAVLPPVVARAGRPGESYAGIRKGEISVEGRPALVDARGPFGNPSSDSDRTKTSPATRRALVITFGSPASTDAEWTGILEGTIATFAKHATAQVAERRVVRAS